METFLEYSNYFFTVVFVIEFILKIIALGPKRYFQDRSASTTHHQIEFSSSLWLFRWNVLDALIVVFSVAGIVVDKVSSKDAIPINPTLIRVIRILRIARGKASIG